MEKKDSLIFYISHYQVLKNLSDEDFGKLYKAFFENQLGNEVELPDELKIPFGLVNNQMVLDSRKYEEKCAKNKENGKKGGRPKKPKKANGYFENPNDNENENDNENDNDNDKDNINDNVNNKDNYLNNSCSCFEQIEKEFGRPLAPSEFEKISLWQNEYADELILYAVEIAVANNKRTIQYVNGILRNWKTLGYKSKQDVLDAEIEREEKRAEELFDYDWLNEEDL
jgi:DnaD/phage-associated family protein